VSALLALLLATAAPAPTVGTSSHIETATSSQSVHEVIVPAQRADVWSAVSTAEGWRGWAATQAWVPAAEAQVIETSYDPKSRPGDPGNIKSLVVLKVPSRLLAFRTVKAPAGFKDVDVLSAITWVIELEPAAGGTRVRLTGSGYPRTAAGERILGFFMSHNPIALRALRDRFATARAVAVTRK
jgi:uncharacterized protein YndB with AHSA1/START domain